MGGFINKCKSKKKKDNDERLSEAGKKGRTASSKMGPSDFAAEEDKQEDSASQQNAAAEQTGTKFIKMVLVGDTSVGKSALIKNYLENSFSEEYIPTVLDVYQGTKNVKKRQIDIEIHDTSGDEQLNVNRAVQYNKSDVFLVCVAINSKTSLENVNKWVNEIRQVCPNTPILLILTKIDLEDYTSPELVVSTDEIKQKTKDMALQGFCQTSSKEWKDFNVHKAFVQAICTGYYAKFGTELK